MAEGPRRSNQQRRLSGGSGFVHLPAEATWVRVCYLDPQDPTSTPSFHPHLRRRFPGQVWGAQHGQENDYWTLLCPPFHISPGQEGREPWGGRWPRGSVADLICPPRVRAGPQMGGSARWEGQASRALALRNVGLGGQGGGCPTRSDLTSSYEGDLRSRVMAARRLSWLGPISGK